MDSKFYTISSEKYQKFTKKTFLFVSEKKWSQVEKKFHFILEKKKFFANQYLYFNTILIYLLLPVRTCKTFEKRQNNIIFLTKTVQKKKKTNLYHRITEKKNFPLLSLKEKFSFRTIKLLKMKKKNLNLLLLFQ